MNMIEKCFQETISRKNSTIYKVYHKWLSCSILQEMQGWLNIHKSIHMIHHIKKKEEKHKIVSTDVEESLTKSNIDSW